LDTLRDQLQQTLGDTFQIERELGGGGMSRVFLATESALGRPVVVKVLREEIFADVSAERFAREVRLAASLQHPNIVSVLTAGAGADGGVPYYTMPFVTGDSLRARIQRGVVPVDEALSILRDVARALAFAHDNRIVHRDIKPENVLLSGDAALVTDFGIAKAVRVASTTIGSSPTVPLTEIGVTLGTPAYMAPEQSSGDEVGPSADVYAWGLIAYELLAGGHPFAGAPSAQRMIVAHMSEKPVALSARNPLVPSKLAALVMQCLEKDPALRPRAGSDVARALNEVSLARSASSPGIGRRTMWISGVAAAAIIGLVGWLGWRGNRSSSLVASDTSSIAVLAFSVVGGDSSNVYFAEGVASELTGALTKVPSLAVASQTSAFAMRKRPELDVKQIGKALDVGAVVEGTVRRAGNRWRVTASLTRTTDGVSLWSQTYERDASDIFAVQDDITRQIVSALTARLSGSASPAVTADGVLSVGTTNPDAYDKFLRGRHMIERRGAGVDRAAAYFSEAIALDSGFARAWAALSEALALYPYFTGVSAASVEPRLRDAAQRALARDSTLANAHMALGLMHAHAFRWKEAGAAIERAAALDSNSAVVRTQYGRYLMYMGKFPEALVQFRAAERLDPAAGTPAVWVAHMLAELGQHDAALAQSKRAWELDSLLATSQTFLTRGRLLAGRPAEAVAMLQHGGRRLPVPFNGTAAYVLYRAGATAAADSIARSLRDTPENTWMRHTGLAFVYLGTGDTARALTELETASRKREITPFWESFSGTVFDPIRESPRFIAVVRSFGLEPVRR
jgi:serine/threonine-protein kinase